MSKRFSARKIKVTSYSRQGFALRSRESFAVYDSKWKQFPRHWSDDDRTMRNKHMYVEFTEWNNKKFVEAVAEYLNDTIGDDISKPIDGFTASYAVLKRDLGHSNDGAYAEWCKKFGQD